MAAEVIRFHPRTAAPAVPHDSARLQQALHGLEAALAEQRAAVIAWREALARLQTTMRGVGDDLQRYRGALDRLHGDVSVLNGQAGQLEHWADSVLTGAPNSA